MPTAPLTGSGLQFRDGKITLGEMAESIFIPGLELASLSACKTGLVNPDEAGDEHFGLAHGLLASGAATVWSSLWSVPDHPTSLLMTEAYKRLWQGSSKAEALWESQQWLREEYRQYTHPLFWAGFTSMGC